MICEQNSDIPIVHVLHDNIISTLNFDSNLNLVITTTYLETEHQLYGKQFFPNVIIYERVSASVTEMTLFKISSDRTALKRMTKSENIDNFCKSITGESLDEELSNIHYLQDHVFCTLDKPKEDGDLGLVLAMLDEEGRVKREIPMPSVLNHDECYVKFFIHQNNLYLKIDDKLLIYKKSFEDFFIEEDVTEEDFTTIEDLKGMNEVMLFEDSLCSCEVEKESSKTYQLRFKKLKYF